MIGCAALCFVCYTSGNCVLSKANRSFRSRVAIAVAIDEVVHSTDAILRGLRRRSVCRRREVFKSMLVMIYIRTKRRATATTKQGHAQPHQQPCQQEQQLLLHVTYCWSPTTATCNRSMHDGT